MAISEVHTFPQFSQFDVVSQFGPTKLRYTFTYRERTRSWYLDLHELNGTPVMLGRRISAKWVPTWGIARIPELMAGVLYVIGRENYEQDDLGTNDLRLWYVPEEDYFFFQSNQQSALEPTVTITSP